MPGHIMFGYAWSLEMKEARQQTTVSTNIDPELVTRTSWVDAYMAYVQITRVCELWNFRS